MSAPTDVRTLYTQIISDSDFCSKLAENPSPEAIFTEIQNYGKRHDMSVSVDDIHQAMTPPDGELSDQELELVVGGKFIDIVQGFQFGCYFGTQCAA